MIRKPILYTIFLLVALLAGCSGTGMRTTGIQATVSPETFMVGTDRPATNAMESTTAEATATKVAFTIDDARALFERGSYFDCIQALMGLEEQPGARDLLEQVYRDIPLAPVAAGQGWQYIDGDGNVVIDLPSCEDAKPFHNGKAIVKQGGKYAFIDKKGALVDGPALDFDEIGSFTGGIACYSVENKNPVISRYHYGFIGGDGNIVIAPIFDMPVIFHGELARASFMNSLRFEKIPDDLSPALTTEYLDRQGNLYDFSISVGNSDLYMDKSELILQELSDVYRVGYMDKGKGKFVFDRETGQFPPLDTTRYIFRRVNERAAFDTVFEGAHEFIGGLAPVKETGKQWGFIDTAGKYVLSPQYDDALRFSQGLAAVCVGGKWGYIDKTGKYVIQPQFNGARIFSEGLAAVCNGAKWGFIDKTGKFVIKPAYSDAQPHVNGMAPIMVGSKDDGLWGLIDKKGRTMKKAAYSGYAEIPEYMKYVDRYTRISNEGIQKYYYWAGDNMRCGFRNDDGLLFKQTWSNVTGFSRKGLAAVCTSYDSGKYVLGKWGIIDRTGKYVVKPSLTDQEAMKRVLGYDYYEHLNFGTQAEKDEEQIALIVASGEQYRLSDLVAGVGEAVEGMVLFAENGLYGFMRVDGSIVVPAKYAKASYFGR